MIGRILINFDNLKAQSKEISNLKTLNDNWPIVWRFWAFAKLKFFSNLPLNAWFSLGY